MTKRAAALLLGCAGGHTRAHGQRGSFQPRRRFVSGRLVSGDGAEQVRGWGNAKWRGSSVACLVVGLFSMTRGQAITYGRCALVCTSRSARRGFDRAVSPSLVFTAQELTPQSIQGPLLSLSTAPDRVNRRDARSGLAMHTRRRCNRWYDSARTYSTVLVGRVCTDLLQGRCVEPIDKVNALIA